MRTRFTSILFLSLFLSMYGCTTLPKPEEPYGYLNPEGAIYYIYVDGNRHYTGFGDGTHAIDIKVKTGMHRLGYANERFGEWTDLFVPASMRKDAILVLKVEPGIRYYIGPEKREVNEGHIFKPVVKEKEKIAGY
ncbi:MAG: hypothetical protein ABIF87_15845 [Pseudomonadota bacterium]